MKIIIKIIVLITIFAKTNSFVNCQTINKSNSQYIVYGDSCQVDTVDCLKYSIRNTLKSRIVIVFSQDDLNDSIPIKRKIYRTLCRTHKDFRLSYYAWESGLSGDTKMTIFPQRFVKIIDSDSLFDIMFETKTSILKSNPDFGLNHILIISEEELKDHGFEHFINGVISHNAEYKNDYIIIRCEDFYQ